MVTVGNTANSGGWLWAAALVERPRAMWAVGEGKKKQKRKGKISSWSCLSGALEREGFACPGLSCQLGSCLNKTGCGGFRVAWRAGDRSHRLGTETCQQCWVSAEKRHEKEDCAAGGWLLSPPSCQGHWVCAAQLGLSWASPAARWVRERER